MLLITGRLESCSGGLRRQTMLQILEKFGVFKIVTQERLKLQLPTGQSIDRRLPKEGRIDVLHQDRLQKLQRFLLRNPAQARREFPLHHHL